MPRQARQLSASLIYHVMLRGVNREPIFLEADDLGHFIHTMSVVRAASGCRILAYCLMPNHVHLVAQTTTEPIGLVMKRLGVRYAGWFNRKYDRVGHLFQDRFKSVPVEDDAYLVTLLRYVWNNPVAAGLVAHAEDYPWSSRRYVGRPVSWIDDDELRRLVPPSTLQELTTSEPGMAITDPDRRIKRLADKAAADVMRAVCGASTSREFLRFDRPEQNRVLRELRSRGVPHRQVSRLTGLSPSAVRRRQVGDRQPPELAQ